MDSIVKSRTSNNIVIGDTDDFKIKGAARAGPRKYENGKHQRSSAKPVEDCGICLNPISDRAVIVPCNHLCFDVHCLLRCLREGPRCPICREDVEKIEYEWAGPEDFKTYYVRKEGERVVIVSYDRPQPTDLPTKARRMRGENYVDDFEDQHVRYEDPALAFRRQVYKRQLSSSHVGSNSVSGYRDFTAKYFRESPELQSRARTFLRRELLAYSPVDVLNERHRQIYEQQNTAPNPPSLPTVRYGESNRESLIEWIVALLKHCEVKGADGKAQDLLAEHIGKHNAPVLLHELQAWLRSPYARLDQWDRQVQYLGYDGGRDDANLAVIFR